MTWPETPERLPSPVVDNHCHMDMPPRGADGMTVDEALDRAAAVNITRIVQVGCDLPGARWAVETAKAYDSVVAAVALHPNEAPRLAEGGTLEEALAEINVLAGSGNHIRAIGETGLDYFRTADEGRQAQHHSFREHIRMAKRHDKTLMIHDRDAHADVLEILDDEGIPDRTVMHCFSVDAEFARAATNQCRLAGKRTGRPWGAPLDIDRIDGDGWQHRIRNDLGHRQRLAKAGSRKGNIL